MILKNNSNYLHVSLVLLVFVFGWVKTSTVTAKGFELYDKAQENFVRKNFPSSLSMFKEFLEKASKESPKRDRLIVAIDKIGYIYLRIRRDPIAAKNFFGKFIKDSRLNEAETISVNEWYQVAEEWTKLKKPLISLGPEGQFTLGKKFFESGMKKNLESKKSLGNGNAELHVAATYLSKLIMNHDDHPQIPSALLMMGKIRKEALWDLHYWGENFYLKEVIRRFPGSMESQQAYQELEGEMKFLYYKHSKTEIPPSIRDMLKNFKDLAFQPTKTPQK